MGIILFGRLSNIAKYVDEIYVGALILYLIKWKPWKL